MKSLLSGMLLWAALGLPVNAQPAPNPDLGPLLGRFEQYADRAREQWQTPGMAVALIVGDRVVYTRGFGVREAGGQQPVTPETLFQIGSISKSFTSALVAQLVDEGKLQWSDRVIDRVPEFRLFDPWVTREFTVEDTMAQRSGMPAYAGDTLAFMGRSREEIMAAMRHLEPVSSFRSQFAYVNNLWLVAARVIERQTGQSWEDNLRQRLLQPLAMTHSNSGLEGLYTSPNHATPHLMGSSGPVPLRQNWPFARWVYTYGPAGGINSNVLDMARYARAQLHGRIEDREILSRSALQRLHAPHIFAGGGRAPQASTITEVGSLSYCLGWLRQEVGPAPIVWHNGGTSGCKAVVGLVPDRNIALVVLSNLGGTELPEALMYRFYDLYHGLPDQDYSSQFLKTQKARRAQVPTRPQPVQPPLPLARYVGLYQNPAYGTARVEVQGESLKLRLGSITLDCRPWNRDTFVFQDFVNPDDPPEFVTFQPDAAGQIGALQLQILGDCQGGLFRRQ